ncbi:LOW QUALITY PROTEIN: BTB/POZ domain-containing protein KCTD6a [Syngnathoides biaculeatus]|uniref:LOW QUALITY PROTEIN: BTB/POZ domain-containing protein KCTD6a n=1 Tax=Syngnathoides biaculeatus TaxID=300417 RepID=UPI002ADD456D|nr:LOW QUALITY PROTEIN: BTB/POZ domain-containing protein KCTD6a [Syngnathoides biaculeatus]
METVGTCYILKFLRSSDLTPLCDFKEAELLRKEADFYKIEPLLERLGDAVRRPRSAPYPSDSYDELLELCSTRKQPKQYSNPVAIIIKQLTVTTEVRRRLVLTKLS